MKTIIFNNTTVSALTYSGEIVPALGSYDFTDEGVEELIETATLQADILSGDIVVNDGTSNLSAVAGVVYVFGGDSSQAVVVSNEPSGNIISTNVQDALNELDSEVTGNTNAITSFDGDIVALQDEQVLQDTAISNNATAIAGVQTDVDDNQVITDAHAANTDIHFLASSVTATDVDLPNVDNTSDVDKPVSNAQALVNTAHTDAIVLVQTDVDNNQVTTDAHAADTDIHFLASSVTATDVNLPNVDNTSDVDKPISDAQALVNTAHVDAIVLVQTDVDNNQVTTDAHAADGTIHFLASSVTAADVDLPNVDNTSDADKPVSTAQIIINSAVDAAQTLQDNAITGNTNAITSFDGDIVALQDEQVLQDTAISNNATAIAGVQTDVDNNQVTTDAHASDTDIHFNLGSTATTAATGNHTHAPSSTPPAGANTEIQYNDSGSFGASSVFTFDAPNSKVDILGTTLDTQLTVGGTFEVDAGNTNATLYTEVMGGGLNDEAARFYWNRSPMFNGWISFDYDGARPVLRLVDEDDDSCRVSFEIIGTGTRAAPQFINAFGGRGGIASATTGFQWEVFGTSIATLDTTFFNLVSPAATYRINGVPLAINNMSDVDTATSPPATNDLLRWDGTDWVPATIPRATFVLFAEENGDVAVGGGQEYSFGNGAINNDANPSGIVIGVNCTLIGIGISANNASGGTSTCAVSIINNGTTVATGGTASGSGGSVKIQNFTQVTPDTVDFVPGDTLQFITAVATGTLRDVRVCAWFERI